MPDNIKKFGLERVFAIRDDGKVTVNNVCLGISVNA